MKYHVTLNGRTRLVEVSEAGVLVDGASVAATLHAVPGTPVRQLVLDGRPVALAVAGGGPGRWTLVSGGEPVEVEVVDERTAHLRSLVGAGRAAPGGGTVKAPMPGLVVRVLVEPGASVAAGEGLVVLEAMKMENVLAAPAAGVVTAVEVRPGQAVEKGQRLVTLEAEPGGPPAT